MFSCVYFNVILKRSSQLYQPTITKHEALGRLSGETLEFSLPQH